MLHYLGKISFGIYIYHNMILNFYTKEIIIKYFLGNIFIFEILYLVIITSMSIISYKLIENHFIKLKKNFELIKTAR